MWSEPETRTPASGFADGHQTGHFLLGDRDLFAAPIGQFHVRDFVVGG